MTMAMQFLACECGSETVSPAPTARILERPRAAFKRKRRSSAGIAGRRGNASAFPRIRDLPWHVPLLANMLQVC